MDTNTPPAEKHRWASSYRDGVHDVKCSCGWRFSGTTPEAAERGIEAHLTVAEEREGTQLKSIGQIAYEAYFGYSDGKSLVSHTALPLWDDPNESDVFRVVKEGWEQAAQAAVYHALRNMEYSVTMNGRIPGTEKFVVNFTISNKSEGN